MFLYNYTNPLYGKIVYYMQLREYNRPLLCAVIETVLSCIQLNIIYVVNLDRVKEVDHLI
jgi:hypothetical protein